MKRLIPRLLAILLCVLVVHSRTTAAEAMPPPARLLFIGNSYTGANQLSHIFRQIVESTGRTAPEIKASTPGGRTFAQHLTEAGSLKLIDEGRWDVVVLQGQSQEAAKSDSAGDGSAFLTGAHGLCQRIRASSPRARIVFYQTWARHADYWTSTKADASTGHNPADMQARNRTSYQRAATQDPDCIVAPVGDAWELNYRNPQAIRLHQPDNSHPAFNGSYLAGLVIYGVIYRPTNFTVTYRGGLPADEATYLQGIAARVMSPIRR